MLAAGYSTAYIDPYAALRSKTLAPADPEERKLPSPCSLIFGRVLPSAPPHCACDTADHCTKPECGLVGVWYVVHISKVSPSDVVLHCHLLGPSACMCLCSGTDDAGAAAQGAPACAPAAGGFCRGSSQQDAERGMPLLEGGPGLDLAFCHHDALGSPDMARLLHAVCAVKLSGHV